MVPTREHWLIKKWAQEYGALPAQIQRLKFDGEPVILTFTFGKPMRRNRTSAPSPGKLSLPNSIYWNSR